MLIEIKLYLLTTFGSDFLHDFHTKTTSQEPRTSLVNQCTQDECSLLRSMWIYPTARGREDGRGSKPDKALALIAALHNAEDGCCLSKLQAGIVVLHHILSHESLMHLRHAIQYPLSQVC